MTSPTTTDNQQHQQPEQQPEEVNENQPAQPAAPLGAQPLDPKSEAIIRYRLSGMDQQTAYRRASKRKMKKDSAAVGASKFFARSAVRDRMSFLAWTTKKSEKTAPPPSENPAPLRVTARKATQDVASEEDTPTPEMVKRAMVKALRADKPDAASIKAILEYIDRKEGGDTRTPDPGEVARWIMDETEARPPAHMRQVCIAVAKLYRVDMQTLGKTCLGT